MTDKHKKNLLFFTFFFKKRLSILPVQSIIQLLSLYGCRSLVTASSIPGQMGNQAAQWNNVGYLGNLQPPFLSPLQIFQQVTI